MSDTGTAEQLRQRFTPIEVRTVPFEFPDDMDPVWNPSQREWSHMINGVSLTMPYLEPFLIATLREAAADIEDPDVLEEIAGFVGQEGQHFRTHRRYNEMLKANGTWRDPRSRLRLWRRTGEFFANVVPVAFRSARPGHDPRDEPDPEWVTRWIAGYDDRPDPDAPPLIDTTDGRLDVPFDVGGRPS